MYDIDWYKSTGITIFSAPNYCDSVGNKGAYINIKPDLELEFHQFDAVPHPAVTLKQILCN